jgi:hypoxanthine phosphoribosyltransferase
MPENSKTVLSFLEIQQRLEEYELPEFDAVVGILTGGLAPAVLCASKLKVDLYVIPIHFRDEENRPLYGEPVLQENAVPLPPDGSRLLLVDDVSVTGSTFQTALKALSGRDYDITTFAMKGKADHVMFPEVKGCVKWPWKIE